MTLFRYRKNGLLYTITVDLMRRWQVHPYRHSVEIGIKHKSRWREFPATMSMKDFEAVADA